MIVPELITPGRVQSQATPARKFYGSLRGSFFFCLYSQNQVSTIFSEKSPENSEIFSPPTRQPDFPGSFSNFQTGIDRVGKSREVFRPLEPVERGGCPPPSPGGAAPPPIRGGTPPIRGGEMPQSACAFCSIPPIRGVTPHVGGASKCYITDR